MTTRVESTFPASPIQQGMLYHHLARPHGGVDIEQIVAEIGGALDRAALERAWRAVVARHDALRSAFPPTTAELPEQAVAAQVDLPFRVLDRGDVAAGDWPEVVRRFLEEDRRRGFDPAVAPLTRVTLLKGPGRRRVMVWTVHHLVCDGRSFVIVLQELLALYRAETTGEPADLAPAPSCAPFHAWLAGRRGEGDDEFWSAALEGLAGPTPLPFDGSGDDDGRGAHDAALDEPTTARLQELAGAAGVTLGTVLQAAWAVTLHHATGTEDVVFGATRSGRHWRGDEVETAVGVFIATVPVRAELAQPATVRDLWRRLREAQVAVRPHEHAALPDIQRCSGVPAGTPLFETLLIHDHGTLDQLVGPTDALDDVTFTLHERTSFPVTLYAHGGTGLGLRLAHDRVRVGDAAARRCLEHVTMTLRAFAEDPGRALADLPRQTPEERRREAQRNATVVPLPDDDTVHRQVEARARQEPQRLAVSDGTRELTFGELDGRASRLAHLLVDAGVGRGDIVGVCLERSCDMVVAVLAVLKAGGAYLPLDPGYPPGRLAFMLADSGARALVGSRSTMGSIDVPPALTLLLDDLEERLAEASAETPDVPVAGPDLAYVIYTSGSTGQPKGVMVEHRNVVNFMAGMDARVPVGPGDTWLAVTSLSFDISVLELLWTLARGLGVVVYAGEENGGTARSLEFSLFYFASDEGEEKGDRYRLLLDGARFADRHGFAAVWTPERHFHAFGGLYPNPSVTAAAVAAVTERVGIRAGSVVLPLHHPVRVAEEWAVVDNISGGRVGVSFASGWQPNDFVLAPDSYSDRHRRMAEGIETVRRLWRGEAVELPGVEGDPVTVRTLPRPVQAELPVWVTTAGNVDTYVQAGCAGARVLTHLLGQTVDEVAEKIRAYRRAWTEAGHGAGGGHVSLMLHTFVGTDGDEVERRVRGPLKDYLRSSLGLIRGFADSWSAYKRGETGSAPERDAVEKLTPEEMEDLLDYAFERYFETSGLLGTPEKCLEMARRIAAAGVDEIACLIDFGVDADAVLAHLEDLDRLRRRAARRPTHTGGPRFARLLEEGGVTHLQCTPSMARLLLADDASRRALAGLRVWLLGGEALPAGLVDEIREVTDARIINMYGPTETTIWSSTWEVPSEPRRSGVLPLGEPIANTRFHILDRTGRPVPDGVAGELHIGGAGVTRGYLGREALTAERFVADPRDDDGGRLYRTGDLVRVAADGELEFLGRADHQVKVRGHRVELGEIEAALRRQPGVRDAVVSVVEEQEAASLAAWVVADVDVEPPALRAALLEMLPEVMVPARIALIDAVPLTPNGKVDRAALLDRLPAAAVPGAAAGSPGAAPRSEGQPWKAPSAAGGAGLPTAAPDPDAPPGEGAAAPPPDPTSTEARESTPQDEEAVAAIWREVLGLSQVGLDDNFFDLGGHSLLAVRVHQRLRDEIGAELSITDLFRYPTVRTLARRVAEAEVPGSRKPASRGESRARARRAARRRS